MFSWLVAMATHLWSGSARGARSSDLYVYNFICMITSILMSVPTFEQELKQRKHRDTISETDRQNLEREPRTNKLHRVRGGCLGTEDRRRTRRTAKRSGGAASKR